MIPQVDHLVVAAPTLEDGILWANEKLGVVPEPGGVHEGFGTHNVLLGLGNACYLEIVSKDPLQQAIPNHWIPADQTPKVKMIGWASPHKQLAELAGLHSGILGKYAQMKRKKADGTFLEWQMTYPKFNIFDGLVPFFIDWGQTPHPGTKLKAIGRIAELKLGHPNHQALQKTLNALSIEAEVMYSTEPYINCTLSVNNQLVRI